MLDSSSSRSSGVDRWSISRVLASTEAMSAPHRCPSDESGQVKFIHIAHLKTTIVDQSAVQRKTTNRPKIHNNSRNNNSNKAKQKKGHFC